MVVTEVNVSQQAGSVTMRWICLGMMAMSVFIPILTAIRDTFFSRRMHVAPQLNSSEAYSERKLHTHFASCSYVVEIVAVIVVSYDSVAREIELFPFLSHGQWVLCAVVMVSHPVDALGGEDYDKYSRY